MTSTNRRDKLLARTRAALRSLGEIEAELDSQQGRPPQSGDLFVLSDTEDLEWAVIEGSADGCYLLVVPADTDPQMGRADVEVPTLAPAGPLTLRCRFENWLEASDLAPEMRTGFLEPGIVERVRRKRAEIELGTLTGSVFEEEVDGDPEYEDREQELKAAQLKLAEAQTLEKVYTGVIDVDVGGYPAPSLDLPQVAFLARSERPEPGDLTLLREAHKAYSKPVMGLVGGVDPTDLTQAGWAVVFHAAESQAVRDALAPLIEYRRAQAGAERTKVLELSDGDDLREWLARNGVAVGDVEPAKVPYYLLLVGSPTRIPFSFQSLLAVEYAVGRLGFDSPGEYRRYAESIIDHDARARAPQGKTVVYFGPRHRHDFAPQRSADLLVRPLVDGVPPHVGVAEASGFTTHELWGERATKANLQAVLHGQHAPPPAVVFAACQGLGWPTGHPEQVASQGALVCQDWPAYGWISPDHCFGAADVGEDAKVHGTIAFLHTAYSAGTPRHDSFRRETREPPAANAPEPFMASLPRRLLAHPLGGALAVIGLVDRAWHHSLAAANVESRIVPFQKSLRSLLSGSPVGHALQAFNERYAARSTVLEEAREEAAFGRPGSDAEVALAWMERNEAQSYVVLGDPAARLRPEVMT